MQSVVYCCNTQNTQGSGEVGKVGTPSSSLRLVVRGVVAPAPASPVARPPSWRESASPRKCVRPPVVASPRSSVNRRRWCVTSVAAPCSLIPNGLRSEPCSLIPNGLRSPDSFVYSAPFQFCLGYIVFKTPPVVQSFPFLDPWRVSYCLL